MGSGKVEMKRIENRVSRLVIFSKRRKEKAHEVAVLCDADVGVVVFSERGRLFEYPTPPASLTYLIHRYEAITNTGEDLSSLASVDELDKLEQQLELALSNVRARKINGGGGDGGAGEGTEEIVEPLPPSPSFVYLLNVNEKSAVSTVLQLWPPTEDDHIIVFSERGRMFFDYPNPPDSLTGLIHRYEAVTNTQLLQETQFTDHQQQRIAEIGSLECKQLEASLMTYTYTGKDLSSLASVDELEQQLESALSKVCARKDELLINLTDEMQLKMINGNGGVSAGALLMCSILLYTSAKKN